LSEPVRQAFVEIVASVDHQHFAPSDMPLLEQYCEAIVLARRSAAELQAGNSKALVTWEKANRVIQALSMRLRLSPQSRREKARAEPRTLDWSTRYGLEHRYGK
jgi:phage terminase small subunit